MNADRCSKPAQERGCPSPIPLDRRISALIRGKQCLLRTGRHRWSPSQWSKCDCPGPGAPLDFIPARSYDHGAK